MVNIKRKPQERRKAKRKVVVRSKAKIAPRGSKKAKNDTLVTQPPRSNSAVFKVKVKKK